MKGVLTMKRTKFLLRFVAIILVATLAASQFAIALAVSTPSVTVTNAADLLAAIENASEGDVIGIDGQITFDSSMVLGVDGKSITLQKASPNSNIYISSTCSATIKNITFDGAELEGTQPFLHSDSYAWVENCTFQNHSSTGSGAVAIWNGTMEFYNCTFQNNTASQSGHIEIGGMCTGIFEGCTFKKGSTTLGGGAITSNGTCKLKDCLLTENSGTTVGGAIRNSGNLTIENSKIFNNTAEIGADIATGLGNPITFADSASELNAMYAPDGFTAEWVKEKVESPTLGNYISWKLVLTEIPTEPTEPEEPEQTEKPDEPTTPSEPEESKQPTNTTTTTNSTTENNPSSSVRVEEPLGTVENNITLESPSDDVLKAYISAYMTDSSKGGTSTPIEQTITVESPEVGSDEPGTLNINVNIGSDLQEASQIEPMAAGASWYQVAVLCLLFGIFCSIIVLAISFHRK